MISSAVTNSNCAPSFDQRFGGGVLEVDVEAGLFGVGARCADGFGGGIDRGELCAHARERRRDEAAAAAKIEGRHAVEWFARRRPEVLQRQVADVLQPHGVEPVQRAERAFGIPPLRRERAEFGDLGGVERGWPSAMVQIGAEMRLVKRYRRRSGAC